VLEVPLDPHLRLAVSPLEDVLNAVRALTRPGGSPVHARWLAATRPALTELDVPELIALITGDVYFPDFLSPPPAGPATTAEDQLRMIARTPERQVLLEMEMSAAGRETPAELTRMLADPAGARDLLVEQMRRCWDGLLAPIWPRLRDVLAADIGHRTRRFGESGIAQVLAELHPSVAVSGSRVLITSSHGEQIELDDRGLLLVPSVFACRVGLMAVPPWQTSLVYPARGTATLWEDVPAHDGDALAGVVGRTKARLLRELSEPASTSALAVRLGVAPSTISGHLRALAAAGLLTARRSGRSVHYRRTPLGDELVRS
jgi:DNA-binding transcriptional ArsR family regulator